MANKSKSQELLNQQIIDAMLDFQIDLRRYESGVAKNIAKILEKMRNELNYALISTTPMSEFDKERTRALIGRISKIINQFTLTAQGELGFATDPLPKIQATQVANMLNTIGISTSAVLPSEYVLARLADNVIVEGNYIADWWEKLAIDSVFRMSASIRQGIVQGESNQKIINRIVGKPGEPGEMDITKRNVAAFVNTAVQTVANEANMKTLQANADVVPMVRWLSALDGRVCERCMARDGLMWKNEDGNASVGHNLPFAVPPIHFNDRCVLIPVTRLFEKMRNAGLKVPEGQRTSELGPVSSKTTFEDFLKRRTEAQQDAQLGKGRAQMWRDGKITLSQLLDGNGRELTLAELRRKYGAERSILSGVKTQLPLVEYESKLKELHPSILQLVEKLDKPSLITTEKRSGWYKSATGELRANPNDMGGGVLRHEYGHHVDFTIGARNLSVSRSTIAISEIDAAFSKAFDADRAALGLKSARTMPANADELAKLFFIKKTEKIAKETSTVFVVKNVPAFDGADMLADIVDAMTGGYMMNNHSIGHGPSYYKEKSARMHETFANLFALRNTESWPVIEQKMPNLASRFDALIKESLND